MANHGGGNPADIEEQSPAATTDLPRVVAAIENPGSRKGRYIDRCSDFLWYTVEVILRPFAEILIILYTVGCIFITGDTSDLYSVGSDPNRYEEDDDNRTSPIPMKKPKIKVKIHQMCFVAGVRMGCLVLIWVAINLGVPSLRRISFLGSLLWKWSLLVAIVLIAHPLLVVLCKRVSLVIAEAFSSRFSESNVSYWIEGLAHCMIWVMHITSLLLTWLLCIDTTIAPLHRYGMLTTVSFLVGAVLNVVKSLVLLFWRTKIIYSKYRGKILLAGCQLYFHLIIKKKTPPGNILLIYWWLRECYFCKRERAEIEDSRLKLLPFEEYTLKHGTSLGDVHEVATYLTDNFELSLTQDDDIPDIAPILQQKFQSEIRQGFSITAAFGDDTVQSQLLLHLLQTDQTSERTPTYEEFEKWMVDGLKNCYAVGYRISAAFEVMKILNRVLTAFIVIVVILTWLFITGFATTKVVVGLASVFLGLTFVFGDACKTFFQGVMFTFVTHPFDVADRCIIDNKELRVKKINILTTAFFGSQPKEIVLYPNSDLATKHIILLHGEQREANPEPKLTVPPESAADLTELVEFSLPSITTSLQIESLQENIEGHLEDGFQSGQYKKSYRVTLMEVGDNIRMRVYFEHNLSNGDNCEHLESIEIRKEKQRSKFLLQLRKFLENIASNV